MTLVKMKTEPRVEARQYRGLKHDLEAALEIHEWIRKNGGEIHPRGDLWLKVGCGEVKVMPGDWVVHYGNGVFAAMSIEMFEEKFEPVED